MPVSKRSKKRPAHRRSRRRPSSASTKLSPRTARRMRRARLPQRVVWRKRCPKGMRRNKTTMICEPMGQSPESSEQVWQYSPAVNKVLQSLKTRSPDAQLFDCGVKEVSVPHGRGRKCVSWDSDLARTAMLRNLNSKKAIVCGDIIAPKQLRANCWFNSFFMCCFVSDMGRKFFRFLRQTMITGALPSGGSISEHLRWPLFLMNKCIEASLRGERDHTRYAWLMDTNLIIKSIYNALTERERKIYNMPRVGDAGNPFLFYAGLIHLLTGVRYESRRSILPIQEFSNVTTSHIESRLSWFFQSLPSIIAYELSDDYSKLKAMTKPRELRFRHRGRDIRYILDSAVLRDVSKEHFTAYITCNRRDYSFDGASYSRLQPFPWRKRLNEDKVWTFKPRPGFPKLRFNFMSGYQMLLYYRVN